MAVTVVTTAATSFGGASPSTTFTGYTPALDDVVVLFPHSTAATATGIQVQANASLPSGWVNPLGDGVEVSSDSHSMGVLYHKVTAGEVSAVTTVYTATSALVIDPANGLSIGIVLRGVDPAAVIDDAVSTFDSGNATPHVLPGLAGANVSTGSLVVAGIGKDTTGSYTAPSGWTLHLQNATFNAVAVLSRTTATTAGVAVAATNITPDTADEYCSVTLALTAAGGGPTPSIYLGTTAIPTVKLGTVDVVNVYLGTTLVWPL